MPESPAVIAGDVLAMAKQKSSPALSVTGSEFQTTEEP